jgi:NADH-quinone oxidoreductase subunit J
MTAPLVLFWLFGGAAVVSAAGVVALRNAVSAAMALVATFFALAGIYVLLWAHTIAVLQVLVYAGAIMVLFLFVIMLLNLTELRAAPSGFSVGRLLGGLGTAGLLAALAHVIFHLQSTVRDPLSHPANRAGFGTLVALGNLLYTRYLLPFEAVSLLLLVAMLGAVVVAKSRI